MRKIALCLSLSHIVPRWLTGDFAKQASVDRWKTTLPDLDYLGSQVISPS
ncbi:hypothetical protein L249_7707, partial [Ophiocordyceps polyrhachis-furcata BCC 54312]